MTNRERAKDIWRAYADHCSSIKLQETVTAALDEAERRGLERAHAATTALAAALDWIGDPDVDDGCWHRWETTEDKRSFITRAHQLAERFARHPKARP